MQFRIFLVRSRIVANVDSIGFVVPAARRRCWVHKTVNVLDKLSKRLHGENHLRVESPEMLGVVRSYRGLDRIAWRLGLLDRTESHATKIAWWPLISVLGTYSSGKSTFINYVLAQPLQKTSNHAVDDRFTVICYGPGSTPRDAHRAIRKLNDRYTDPLGKRPVRESAARAAEEETRPAAAGDTEEAQPEEPARAWGSNRFRMTEREPQRPHPH
jgi:hypothetical protein